MSDRTFQAYVVDETPEGFKGSIQRRSTAELPAGELLVEVAFSSINYKDALSARGNRGVTKAYPHTPGIDAAGRVVESRSSLFSAGDDVIVTDYDLGMNTPGGFGQYIRVPAEWAVPLPEGLTMREAMVLGTAGLTAALSVLRLAEMVKPEDGPIAVTGATGGVGVFSIMLLSALDYTVSAVTGKESEGQFLRGLGAAEILMRDEFEKTAAQPLLKGRFAGGIDTVGGTILANLIKSVKILGTVTCCGNAASADLDLTVYPFILRGVSLIGISMGNTPMPLRVELWRRLSQEWKPSVPGSLVHETGLAGLEEVVESMLAGRHSGRTVVRLQE